MNSFKDGIKVSTEEKTNIINRFLTNCNNMGIMGINFLKPEEEKDKLQAIINRLSKKFGGKLSPEEIIAVANIANEIIEYYRNQYKYLKNPDRKKLMELLYSGQEIVPENSAKIVNATFKDISEAKAFNLRYSFIPKHVLDIMDGKDPYIDYREEQEKRSKFKIVE